MAAVSFKRVSKTYSGGIPVVRDLSLEIADAELLVLVGPSGCGKSTTMRMLAGLEEISAGEICIDERVVNDLPPQARNVAMVFQNYALYPHMSVRRNLEFPLRMQKLPRDERARRVERAARMLDLAALLDRRPSDLSGGQRQRVAMGRAIVRDAAVFLMDEPLSNLDARLRAQIRTDIAELQQQLGITTLYVTHDQVEAMTLGHRVAVMRAGALEQVASARELYDSPMNVFVAGFIGSPGMNVLRGRLEQAGGGLAVCLDGERRLAVGQRCLSRHRSLGTWIGREVLAGLRPEGFSTDGGQSSRLRGTVKAVESLGHATIVYVDAGVRVVRTDDVDGSGAPIQTAAGLVASLRGHHALRPAQSLDLAIDPQALYFFDSQGHAIP